LQKTFSHPKGQLFESLGGRNKNVALLKTITQVSFQLSMTNYSNIFRKETIEKVTLQGLGPCTETFFTPGCVSAIAQHYIAYTDNTRLKKKYIDNKNFHGATYNFYFEVM
jgi:hypothetical protein